MSDSKQFPMAKSDDEYKKELSEEQYAVLREKATEKPFTGKYVDMKDDGMYVCAACGEPLFDSETKFDSGSGWPSFFAPAGDDSVMEQADSSHGMQRTEVVCKKCGSHLGHVFNDGPVEKTGMRYCINSCALDFKDKK